MKKIIFIFLILTANNFICQNAFLKYYNQDVGQFKYKLSFDRGEKILEVKDGYIIMGYNEEDEEKVTLGPTSPPDTTRPMFIKVDKQGNVLWNKRYENKTCSFGTANFIKTSNNEYIGVGGTLMPGDSCGYTVPEIIRTPDPQLYMQKINDNGNIVWQKTIGESINKTAQGADGITPTKDGNYFVIGSDDSYPWLLKINEQGDTLFTKKYPSLYGKGSVLISSLSDGYLIFSYFGSLISKINEQGDLLWTKNSPSPYGIVKPSKDGGFLFLTFIYQTAQTPFMTVITKIDKDLNFLWQKTYPVYGNNALCETNDGNYTIGQKDFAKVSPSGDVLWNKRFWGTNNITPWYYFLDVIQTSDGGFLATGFYDGDTFLIKTDCNGNLEWDTKSCLLETDKDVLIFPNPFTDQLIIQLPFINKDSDKVSLQITNALGQIIYSESFSNQNIFTLQTSPISQGIYFLTIFVNNSVYCTKKVIKQ